MRILVPFLAFAACVAAPVAPDNVLIDMGQIDTATDGRCFANDVASAVIETVTIQEVDQPELRDADGTITRPASFRTITRQQIVRERTDIRFETICPQNYTAEFVTTLQWALKARGIYAGAINGTLDAQTGAAIQRFQRRSGPDPQLLAIETARTLGIAALSRARLNAG